MKKEIFGIGVLALAALIVIGAAAVAQANPLPAPDYTPNRYIVPDYKPIDEIGDMMPQQDDVYVQALQGFAMEKDALASEPAALVRMSYNGKEYAYLFIGEEHYKLTQAESRWVRNGQLVRYSVEGMDESLLLYSNDNFYSNAFGWLGGKMVVFQPGNYYYPMPVYGAESKNQTLEEPPVIVPIPTVPVPDEG